MQVRVALAPHETLRFSDVVLVVDVLRATTTATALLERGLRTLILADSLTSAQALRQESELLVGEAGGLTPEAFDFGNSPLELGGTDFSGKTAILTTSNGTRAAHLAARRGKHVLLACLNNASAACRAALQLAEQEVTIVCAGMAGEASPDDTLHRRCPRDSAQRLGPSSRRKRYKRSLETLSRDSRPAPFANSNRCLPRAP